MPRPTRSPTVYMGAEHREKIAKSGILKRVMDHAMGLVKMTSTELKAAEICLNKVLPNVTAIESSHIHHIEPLSPEQTIERLAAINPALAAATAERHNIPWQQPTSQAVN